MVASTDVARPLARTYSMRVAHGARHAVLATLLAVAAAVPLFFFSRSLLDEQSGAVMVRTHDDAPARAVTMGSRIIPRAERG